MIPEIKELERALYLLNRAVASAKSKKYCHYLWSKFIRLRDSNRCLICDTSQGLAAHHIFRKSFLERSRFDTGNGLTLCKDCHKTPHSDFNRRADLDLPMDAQGGEKIELALEYLEILLADAREREILRDDFYDFSDYTLGAFKSAQSIDPYLVFPGTKLEQAYSIWLQTPRKTMQAILEANGYSLPPNFIQHPSGFNIFMK